MAEALPDEPPVHLLDRVDSTLDAVHAVASSGARPGTAVVAREQTAGRGSRGSQWSSAEGGLWLSVLLRPASPAGVELLSLRVGLAVTDALAGVAGLPPLALKWPNDLMLGDAKVGGVLCEARWEGRALAWVAVGVGINVANPLPHGVRFPVARLADCCPGLQPRALLPPILRYVRVVGGGERLTAGEQAAYAGRDWLRGRTIVAPIAGTVLGMSADGSLRVASAEGPETLLRAGPVEVGSAIRDGACS